MSRRKNGCINALDAAILKAQREALRYELVVAGWSIAGAAKQLGVSRSTVWRLVRKLGLMKPGKVMVRRLVKA